jgi:hypothetical protein
MSAPPSQPPRHFPTFVRLCRLFAKRPPRMTRRRWTISTVILAVLFVAGTLISLRFHYLELARQHGLRAKSAFLMRQPPLRVTTASAARHVALQSYYEGLVRKYRHAASRPWLPIDADPPPPD